MNISEYIMFKPLLLLNSAVTSNVLLIVVSNVVLLTVLNAKLVEVPLDCFNLLNTQRETTEATPGPPRALTVKLIDT